MCKLKMRDLREDRDLSQKDMSLILNCTQTCISKWELGQTDIPNKTLIDLADYFNVSTDYILGKTNDPTPPKEREKTKEPEKKYSPAVIKAAEDIREIFRKRKGREPNENDLQIIKQFADTFIKGID